MTPSEQLFELRYAQLNDRQREAVDTIFGPVMVIAGPGTGKTEVLSMRIANLLRSEAQVQPQEILCLTYTDEATNSMRRRLVQIIGTAAHKVHIHTFHAFCNQIIQNNSEAFSFRDLQPITDLELADLLRDLLNGLPQGHLLRKLSGDLYYDTPRLKKLFGMMKSEYISPETISHAIDAYVASLPQREEFIYKRKFKDFKAGDPKQALIDEEVRKMEITRAAAGLFPVYEAAMRKAGRYDFSDMILWVLDAFKSRPWLLQSYQERYQFILVDEYQDTNGAQNELINTLTSYWDDPNIFVVGDDDQSIYEFQGARIRNITDFYHRYSQTIRVIVLPYNYRSSQQVIDRAMATIGNNQQRLINQISELSLDKNIIASAPRFISEAAPTHPVINVYSNELQEEADVVAQIEQLKEAGIGLSEVAVLYAQHKQASNIMAMLERKGIPYNAKKAVNVLDVPVIRQLLNLLKYLAKENSKPFGGEEHLFELLHAPWWGISADDIATIAMFLQTNRKYGPWRILINNHLLLETLDLKTLPSIRRLSDNLEGWQRHLLGLKLPLLLERMVYEGGITQWLLAEADHVWNMQVLYSFFTFINNQCERMPRFGVRELIDIIDRMDAEQLVLPAERVIQNDNGVRFYTAHSSKGNEFEYVFLIGCTKKYWEGKADTNRGYKLPDTLTLTDSDQEGSYKTEVSRRLFYVALTRAKKYLSVSYALNDNAGKSLETSVFVDEISLPEDRVRKVVDEATAEAYLAGSMKPVSDVIIKMANAVWIERTLQQFTMSATSLARYLYCPLAFYYELILKVPFQKNDALAFGSAVHYALEHFFVEMKTRNGVFPDRAHLLGLFDKAMFRESGSFTDVQFERRAEQGHTVLGEYYDHYWADLHKDVEIEYKVPRYLLDGVPVTAKIDKMELHADGVQVVDYKTGDPDKSASGNTAPPSEKVPNGGDYWRQMILYKLFLENMPDRQWRVTSGKFDYVQKNAAGAYKQVTIPIFKQDEEFVLRQLKDAYAAIMNHEFSKGCGRPECHWCNFARQYTIVRPAEGDVIEMDEE